ncbi:hypothetical protein ACJX0J_029191, partial [Zea mays]
LMVTIALVPTLILGCAIGQDETLKKQLPFDGLVQQFFCICGYESPSTTWAFIFVSIFLQPAASLAASELLLPLFSIWMPYFMFFVFLIMFDIKMMYFLFLNMLMNVLWTLKRLAYISRIKNGITIFIKLRQHISNIFMRMFLRLCNSTFIITITIQ